MVFGSDTELGERRTRIRSQWNMALSRTCFMTWDRLLCFSASLKCRVWEMGKEKKMFFWGLCGSEHSLRF